MNTKPIIFIAGATGLLGTKLVDAALKKNLVVRALVRDLEPSAEEKKMQLADWVSRGVVPIAGDVLERESLAGGVQGADIVISAVGNVEPILDMGQKNLIYACKAAGVKRFVPSDFSVDYFNADLGDNYNLDYRITTFAFLKQSGVPWTSVLNGAFTEVHFTDFAGLLDQKAGTFSYWGDGDTPCDFTLVDDAASYTIHSTGWHRSLPSKFSNKLEGSAEHHGESTMLLKRCGFANLPAGLRGIGPVDYTETLDSRKRTYACTLLTACSIRRTWQHQVLAERSRIRNN